MILGSKVIGAGQMTEGEPRMAVMKIERCLANNFAIVGVILESFGERLRTQEIETQLTGL
jgi:hypothetical protein